MTRGKLVIFGDDYILSSVEYNGDMYWTGHGREARRRLKKVKTRKDFIEENIKFDEENFGYARQLGKEGLIYYPLAEGNWSRESLLDMNTDYFKKWFSDYLYIKNLSKENLIFTCRNARGHEGDIPKRYMLAPGKIGIFRFGEVAENEADDFKNKLKVLP